MNVLSGAYIDTNKRYASKCFPLPEMRYIKARGANDYMCLAYAGHIVLEVIMEDGHFYFIKDEFYDNLPDCNLMTNKGYGVQGTGGRPCHYCLKYDDYYWMIPISSKVEKFRNIYNNKIAKRGYCDTICFGFVNGEERAFLVQNCFPVVEQYIDCEYRVNKNTVSVTVSTELSSELNGLVRKVIRLYESGIIIPLTKLDRIMDFLKNK